MRDLFLPLSSKVPLFGHAICHTTSFGKAHDNYCCGNHLDFSLNYSFRLSEFSVLDRYNFWNLVMLKAWLGSLHYLKGIHIPIGCALACVCPLLCVLLSPCAIQSLICAGIFQHIFSTFTRWFPSSLYECFQQFSKIMHCLCWDS